MKCESYLSDLKDGGEQNGSFKTHGALEGDDLQVSTQGKLGIYSGER